MSKFMINDACCKESPGGGDDNKDCLDKWKDEYEEACNDYNEAAAETQEYNEAYSNAAVWEAKVLNWYDLIKESDKNAKEIITQLDFFLAQVEIVCKKALCTNSALEKLTCLVKNIFDCFYSYQNSNRGAGLKELIENFKKAIECLKNVSDEDKAEVMACILAYEEKIKEVCAMQEEVLCKLIETLQCANLLFAWICEEGGLKYKLKGIKHDFDPVDHDDDDCDPGTSSDDKSTDSEVQFPCDDTQAKPVPEFPLDENSYYTTLGEALEIAIEKTSQLKQDWMNSKKVSDALLSKKNSLGEAIKAAEAAESAK